MRTRNDRWPMAEIKRTSFRLVRAFTLIELLTVISIIALLAGLITWGTMHAGIKKVETRVKTELAGFELALDDYYKKYGFYPPSNSNDVALAPLYYELTGTEPSPAEMARFNTSGIMNTEKKNFMRELKASSYESLAGTEAERAFVVPYKGPNPIGGHNTWRYNSFNPTNNPDSYDLWAEVVVAGRTNIYGNWRE